MLGFATLFPPLPYLLLLPLPTASEKQKDTLCKGERIFLRNFLGHITAKPTMFPS